MRFISPLLLFTIALLNASEPSVFGAGDLNHPNPYGLTHEEKLILENKKEIQAVLQKNSAQNAKVQTVAERIEGMQGILEGLSQQSNENSLALKKIQERLALDANTSGIINDLSKQVQANTENIAQFKTLMGELSHIVDGINANYVTKEQFAALIKQLKINLPTQTSLPVSSVKGAGESIEQRAMQLFNEKKYDDAQQIYQQMIQQKSKVPESLYMIGETYYERGNFKEAILYYKDSASRNEKALYMPTLLLHSGISMEKIGDMAAAKAFYNATVSKYNGSGAAKEAQERLSKVK